MRGVGADWAKERGTEGTGGREEGRGKVRLAVRCIGAEEGWKRGAPTGAEEGREVTGFFGGGLRRRRGRSVAFECRVEFEVVVDPLEVLGRAIRELLDVEVCAE